MPVWKIQIQIQIRAAIAGNTSQRKIDEIFKEFPNVLGIADDI